MLLPRIRSFAPLAALLLACDATPTPRAVAHSSSADAETPALTEMAAKPDAKAASEEGAVLKSAGDGRPKSLAKADAATLQETRAQLLAALNEGRAHVKAGRHDEGIEKFEALLKIDPHHRAALSELGWAEFKAGRHDVARAHTLRALSLAEEPGQRGMLQYNLGRVAEARSQPSVALAHYEQSLALRANKTVEARRDALREQLASSGAEAPASVPGATSGPGLAIMKAGLVDLDAVCEYAAKESMCYGELCEKSATMASAPGFAMIEVGESQLSCWHPAVRVDGGWTLFEHALMGQHGSEVDEDVDDLRGRVITSPSGQVMIYDFKEHVYERDWDYAELEARGDDELPGEDSTDAEGLVFCHVTDGAPACSPRLYRRWRFLDSDGGNKREYSATLALSGGALTVSEVVTAGALEPAAPGPGAGPPWRLPSGPYPLATLSRPGAR